MNNKLAGNDARPGVRLLRFGLFFVYPQAVHTILARLFTMGGTVLKLSVRCQALFPGRHSLEPSQ